MNKKLISVLLCFTFVASRPMNVSNRFSTINYAPIKIQPDGSMLLLNGFSYLGYDELGFFVKRLYIDNVPTATTTLSNIERAVFGTGAIILAALIGCGIYHNFMSNPKKQNNDGSDKQEVTSQIDKKKVQFQNKISKFIGNSMNKSFKTVSLAISIASAIPVVADTPHCEVPIDNVVGTVGGNIARVEQGDAIGTVSEPIAQITAENTGKKNESTLQRLCNFLSKNKIEIISCGLVSAFFLYRIFYVNLPEIYRLQQEITETKLFNKELKEFLELVKNTKPNLIVPNN